MGAEEEQTFSFACPECAETLQVNVGMKKALIANGCVICGASVSSDAFTSTTSASSV